MRRSHKCALDLKDISVLICCLAEVKQRANENMKATPEIDRLIEGLLPDNDDVKRNLILDLAVDYRMTLPI